MTLRSVNPYTSYQVLLDLQRTKEHMATLTEQIASGNRLTKLGDDPTASALVLNFQNSIQQNDGYIKQADSATSFLQTSETAVQAVSDSISQLQVLLIQAGSTASGRLATVEGVKGIRDNLLALANTQSQGKYLFAGTNTTKTPFSLTAPVADYATLNQADYAALTGSVYKGDQNQIRLDVSASTNVITNLAGDSVFFNGDATVPPTVPPGLTGLGSKGDIFTQVTKILACLNNSPLADSIDPVSGKTNIQTASDNVDQIFGNIQSNIAVLGGRQSSLNQLKDNMGSYNLSLASIQDSYQALDYPTALSEFSQAQISQQASLSMLGKANNLNLFNYLA